MSAWLAVDVGGANLKAADGLGYAASAPFPLWKTPEMLASQLAAMISRAPPCDSVAATMTGELADCYATKAEGVSAIVAALQEAAGPRRLLIYTTDGELVEPSPALAQPLSAAASNWHALASYAARFVPVGGLLLDIGSTTTDIIPIVDGKPAADGRTDTGRLVSGELVYSGVVRTPVCALVSTLPWRGMKCRVAAELFATTWDAYLILGALPEEPEDRNTADGRPATKALARDRLARMICADRSTFDENQAGLAALAVQDAQIVRLATAAERLWTGCGRPECAVIGGQGEFLARAVLARIGFEGRTRSLGELLGPAVSQVAPAHALAILARERLS